MVGCQKWPSGRWEKEKGEYIGWDAFKADRREAEAAELSAEMSTVKVTIESGAEREMLKERRGQSTTGENLSTVKQECKKKNKAW